MNVSEAKFEPATGQATPFVSAGVTHPLQPLTGEEMHLAMKIAGEALGLGADTLFELVELNEPSKDAVWAFQPGDPILREARVNVYPRRGLGVWRCTVSLAEETLLTKTFHETARPMIQPEEFLEVEACVKLDPRFVEACAKRGITDMSMVCVDPWSAGNFGVEGEEGLHLSHTFAWVRTREDDNLYAHPLEGLNAVVDIKTMTVLRVDDHGGAPVPWKEVNYAAQFQGEFRDDLKPIDIEQKEGVSFVLDGHHITWADWSMVIGFSSREGLTLHDIKVAGRPVIYRASIAEMVVPYGSTEKAHFRKNVFDIGEYGIGKLANSLKLGCDCLGAIAYLDAVYANRTGETITIENAICIHEEDDGIAWKHWDFRTEKTEVRRARRLVISSIATVGNYEYGFYWYFHLDGTIEHEIKATGIINTVACEPGSPGKYGVEVAPGVSGQIHQHLFCARLDMAIDGKDNCVVECNTLTAPMGPENPYGNAFWIEETTLETECGRSRNADTERYWKFVSASRKNAVGRPTAYKLHPVHAVRNFYQPGSPSGMRASFTDQHLWVTAFAAEERYPAGDHVNHSDGSDGVAAYAAKGRPVAGEDLVAWHVFGLHHQPRVEDFPVQPCVTTGFTLMPTGFFDGNPNMDLPPDINKKSSHVNACCHAAAAE
ncbi:primary-amine oxidase [Aurantimonas sp. 22II-16-19i]|uniref:primary-amine oxidase n=1 Tax=Aurantimonas sp. 22II-16-19i TaxID=1317114 RepID=UPI0009F7C59B|nr:primary-amine oxidase [Aurantimonas sp. 22II-16-19i]ORE97673.1 tyramine oxidase [Aurantimonas sp. 22II-16-19i]